MATNFSPCKGSYVLNQFPSNVMFGMNGFHVSASGAIQGHTGPSWPSCFICMKGMAKPLHEKAQGKTLFSVLGTNKPDCDHCLDNPKKKCKHCACCVCGGKNDPDAQILCDECNQAYHLTCLNPPLSSLPEEDEW